MDSVVCNVDCNIMVFRPTMEEFSNFSEYVRYMESKGAHKAGVAKIVPPEGWRAKKEYNMNEIGEMVIQTPVSQTVTGHQGLFQLFNVQKKPMCVNDLKELSETDKYKGPSPENPDKPNPTMDEKVERQYWKNITFNQPIYGADVPGSIFDDDVDCWNISRLESILDLLGTSILGVNTPYLYFGMWKTTFPWHTEDMDLYSINYLHFGAPKSWYSISPEQGKRLETLAKGFFSGSFRDCSQFLRHKMTIISPQVLKKFSIPVQRMTQYEGEFMITFPYGYHSGYNHGFNCAESTNFASERWIDYGRRAKHCQCKIDSVKIDMDIFIRNYLPEEWRKIQLERRRDEGVDNHNKRKTARANYTSETSPLKLNIVTGGQNGFEIRKKLDYKLEKTGEESESDTTSSEDSDSSGSSEDSSSEGSDDSYKGSDTTPSKGRSNSKFRCNYNRDMHKKELSSKKSSANCSRSRRQGVHKKLSEKNKSNNEKVPVYETPNLLKELWNSTCPNRNVEHLFNTIMSNTETKCAVCIYLSEADSTYVQSMVPSKYDVENQNIEVDNQGTKVLVTELCFAMNNSVETSIETAFNLMFGSIDTTIEARLLTCSVCQMCVHNTCYGISDHDPSENWICDKCRFLNSYYEKLLTSDPANVVIDYDCVNSLRCSLCSISGGALKETTSGTWCHIVCAIAIPEVVFLNKEARGPIDITNLNPARMNLHCLYCSHLSKSSSNRGACIQCKCGKCANAFHVTCSFHYGIPLYLGNWPVCIETLCPKHAKFKAGVKVEKRSLTDVSTDDQVFAKHKNGRYYRGKIIDIQKILYYKVVFDDKSFCFDLPPDDIQGVDARANILPSGEEVDILWPDSMTYHAEVIGHWYETLCQVRYEDGSILQVKRSDLYVDGEEIPKKIQSKLSYASETKNKLNLPSHYNTSVESKRPRNVSYRFRNQETN